MHHNSEAALTAVCSRQLWTRAAASTSAFSFCSVKYHVIAPEKQAAVIKQRYRSTRPRLRVPVLETPESVGQRISRQDCDEHMRFGVRMNPAGPRDRMSSIKLKRPHAVSIATRATSSPSRVELELESSAAEQKAVTDMTEIWLQQNDAQAAGERRDKPALDNC
jgi:hypothetical protein